jgi:hypothetical protein
LSTTKTFNNSTYSIPANRESRGWGTSLSAFLIDVADNALSKAGGNFTLAADVNFGATYGLTVKYLKSYSNNVAAAGVIRLANADTISWRNNANGADIALTTSASDRLTYGGVNVPTISSTDTLTNKTLSGNTATNLISGSGTLTLNTTGTVTVPNATDTLVGKATTDVLTNKTLSGNTATNLISGSGTLTLNTTGTITVPNATDTLVGKATTDTLTNKTITAPSFASYTDYAIITAQSAPGSGVRVYGKSDGKLYKIDSVSGLESAIGGGLAPEAKTTGFTAVAGKHYLVNTTSGAVAVQLPAGTSEAAIKLSDANETWDTYNVTITPATGETIDSLAANETLVCDVKRGWVELSWNGSRWVLNSLASTTVAEASASTTGTVNTTTQSFGGLKTFNDGVKLDDAAGQSTFNYYQEDDTTLASCTFQGNSGGSASGAIAIKITRIGRIVTLDIPSLTTVVPTTASVALLSNTNLPTWARPSAAKSVATACYNGGAWTTSAGYMYINTTGRIEFYRDIQSTAFTNSANAGWYWTQITYTV